MLKYLCFKRRKKTCVSVIFLELFWNLCSFWPNCKIKDRKKTCETCVHFETCVQPVFNCKILVDVRNQIPNNSDNFYRNSCDRSLKCEIEIRNVWQEGKRNIPNLWQGLRKAVKPPNTNPCETPKCRKKDCINGESQHSFWYERRRLNK